MRINKFIALHTTFSRRKADFLIKNGEVKLNGKITTNLGIDINIDKDIIEISDEKINTKTTKVYLALNKPAGYITSRADNLNRKTIMELLPKDQNLKPTGRLDKETEGLILITNDGDFINRYTHPKFECEKEYFCKITGLLTDDEKQKLQNGIIIDNKKTSKAKILIISRNKTETTLKIIIHEGRNRQIRKMFAFINLPVKYLQRIRIGEVPLGKLPIGHYRLLTPEETNAD